MHMQGMKEKSINKNKKEKKKSPEILAPGQGHSLVVILPRFLPMYALTSLLNDIGN